MRERTAGICLTESFAMLPTAAVSGWYFSHPQAHYFGVGKIDRDQVASYAQRKGMTAAPRRSAGWRRIWVTTRIAASGGRRGVVSLPNSVARSSDAPRRGFPAPTPHNRR